MQISEFAPTLAVRARSAGTRYHAHLKLDNNLMPGSSQIYNNHIPVDPDLQGVLPISKTTPLLNVMRGQLVPYVITYKNVTDVPLFDVSIVDRIPAGFRYVEGSARIDRVPVEPARRRPRAHLERSGRRSRRNSHSCSCCSPSAPASAKASS